MGDIARVERRTGGKERLVTGNNDIFQGQRELRERLFTAGRERSADTFRESQMARNCW